MFGEIRNGIIGLSDVGNIAAIYLQKIPELKPNVALDEFIVMPNHIPCIIEIMASDNSNALGTNAYGKLISGSISSIINQYKGAVKEMV